MYKRQAYDRARAWRYAGSQPAVNRLMQAIGRPIRKAADRALVVLLEKRLMQRGFKICMPEGIHTVETVDSDRTARHTKRFFSKYPDPARHSE